MIFKFIKRLFCFHEWEVEQDILSGEYYKVCRKCNYEK